MVQKYLDLYSVVVLLLQSDFTRKRILPYNVIFHRFFCLQKLEKALLVS